MDARIEQMQRRSAQDARVIPLAGGLPAERTFPRRQLARALAPALGESSDALQYGWPEGREQLRAWIAASLRARGARVATQDVIVTSGAQQALAIAAQLTCRAGQSIAVSRESYPAALDLFRSHGLEPCPELEGAAAAYVMPVVDNPRGQGLRPEQRALLAASRVPILEDDAYADLRFAGRSPPPLLVTCRDRVWHIGTFSKTICPGLRVGWLVPPPSRFGAALSAKQVSDLQANSLAQAMLERFLVAEDFEARLSRLRRFYARRAERLARALRRHLPGFRFEEPRGGFSIWVETDDAGDDADLLSHSIAAGTSFDPGRAFRHDGASSPIAFRLAYSFADAAEFDEAVLRLARAFTAHGRSRRRPRAA